MDLAPGAWRWALPPLVLAVPLAFVSPLLGGGAAAVAAAVLAFHRDPERDPPPGGVVSPADGRVSVIRTEDDRVRVGVFMGPTDVHVNRAPVGGRVAEIGHSRGGHWPAFTKASERNERVRLVLDGAAGAFEVTLVAGAVARRIHPYVERGEEVRRGDRIGHVSFGSRADVLLPAAMGSGDVLVENGDRVRAGETVIAESDGSSTGRSP